MSIVDKRGISDRSAKDRKKFIERVKKKIKEQVDDIAKTRNISDMDKGKAKVNVSKRDISEPQIGYDSSTSEGPVIIAGNEDKGRGDKVKKPPSGSGSGPGNQGEGEDDFAFTLTREEFMNLLFDDMELPDFVKEAIAEGLDFKWRRAGVVKDGIHSRLNIRKTMENAIARRIAAKGRKVPYIEEIDLRYDHKVKEPKPIRHAVMFCAMDVSASMTEDLKDLAKRFFLLLYLFLERSYNKVTLRFIRFTQDAREVDEEEFFYGRDTGGTDCSCALELILNIIDEEYDLSETNIYVAQASDGEDWKLVMGGEHELEELFLRMFDVVQYYTYVEVRPEKHRDRYSGITIASAFEEFFKDFRNANSKIVRERSEVYPALHDLFKRAVK